MVEQVSKELSQRILISVIGIPVFIGIFYAGGLVLQVALGILSAIAMWEYRRILFKDKPVWLYFDVFLAICVYMAASLVKDRICPTCMIPPWATIGYFFIVQSLVWFARKSADSTWKDYFMTLWGLFYIAVIPGLIFRIDLNYHNEYLLLSLVILIWITDCFAYFVGMRFGKHRGIFPVSPKKSLEGFIAGIIAPILAVVIYYTLIPDSSLSKLITLAICAGVFGQLGDLLESKIKRIGGVKDSSNIIPGHGGILDRFDSLLLAGPVMYCILTFIH